MAQSEHDSSDSSSDSDVEKNNKKHVSIVHERGTGIVRRVRALTFNFTCKIKVECNAQGKGWDEMSTLQESYIGYLARTRIPITYKDWRNVPYEIKNSLFDCVAQAFDPVDKRLILTSFCDKFRDFRKVLTKIAKTQSKEPPSQYDIDQAQWDEFLRQRCTKSFQELSAKNSANAKKIKYHHKLSRKGYKRRERELLIERGEDVSSSSIPRDELWMDARTVASGKIDPDAAHIASQIVEVRQKVSQGLLKPTKKQDILAIALGKEDHPGRVVAAGSGTRHSDFFGQNKRRRGSSGEEVLVLRDKVTNLESMVDLLVKEVQELRSGRESQGEINTLSKNDSCSFKESDAVSEPNKGEWRCCQLYWPDLKVMVAKGRAFIPTVGSYTLIHGININPKTQLKVNVGTVMHGCESVELPFSNGDEDCITIRHAVGGFIAWPIDLVICVETDSSKSSKIVTTNSKKDRCPDNEKSIESLTTSFSSKVMSVEKLDVNIEMPTEVFQYNHVLHFGKKELDIWLKGEELEAIHIAIYMRCLYENDKSSKYAFLCPSRLAWPVGNDSQTSARAGYMADSFLDIQLRGRLWFAPYNGGYHWMLGAIDPCQSTVYWFDPLGSDVRKDFKDIATKALKRFKKETLQQKKTVVRWITIKCPKQNNNYQCGYYICRYMREIMEAATIRIPEQYFEGSPSTYGVEHIEDIHTQWLKFVEPFVKAEMNQH